MESHVPLFCAATVMARSLVSQLRRTRSELPLIRIASATRRRRSGPTLPRWIPAGWESLYCRTPGGADGGDSSRSERSQRKATAPGFDAIRVSPHAIGKLVGICPAGRWLYTAQILVDVVKRRDRNRGVCRGLCPIAQLVRDELFRLEIAAFDDDDWPNRFVKIAVDARGCSHGTGHRRPQQMGVRDLPRQPGTGKRLEAGLSELAAPASSLCTASSGAAAPARIDRRIVAIAVPQVAQTLLAGSQHPCVGFAITGTPCRQRHGKLSDRSWNYSEVPLTLPSLSGVAVRLQRRGRANPFRGPPRHRSGTWVRRASVFEARQYGRTLLPYGIQAARIESEELQDCRSNLCRLDEARDGSRPNGRIRYE
jgi:hypothetical protein